jgi:protein-S-isoprenylcysteine O-methyltransferase Ste14
MNELGRWLEYARYWMAVLFVVSLPPALAWWFVIHPFANFWRRRGTGVTFAVIGALFVGAIAALLPFRDALLGADLGFRLWLLVVAAPLMVISAVVARARRKHLKVRMLLGVPEVAPTVDAPQMLSEGIYGRIRHPRYVEFVLGLAGWALILDYAGLYVALAATVPVLHAIVLLEERELRERFGPAYSAYMARVPRYLPRR